MLLASEGLIKLVPLDTNSAVSVGLVIGTDDVFLNDGVRILDTSWDHLCRDAVVCDIAQSLRISVRSVYKAVRNRILDAESLQQIDNIEHEKRKLLITINHNRFASILYHIICISDIKQVDLICQWYR